MRQVAHRRGQRRQGFILVDLVPGIQWIVDVDLLGVDQVFERNRFTVEVVAIWKNALANRRHAAWCCAWFDGKVTGCQGYLLGSWVEVE